MKKLIFVILAAGLFAGTGLFAQSEDDLFSGSDDELFSTSDDDLFGASDDDLFGGDGIEVVEDVQAKTDLSKGTLFENGSIKIGGNFSTSLSTSTVLYSEAENSFGDNLKNTKLTPTASAFLSVDARPTQVLRMYTKFGIAYPYTVYATTLSSTDVYQTVNNSFLALTSSSTTVFDWFKLKELFTDFSIADRAFFRFGLHTVTWGTGYFFSPVSDLINTSSINPEDTSAQVEGSLNLRTQITFPDSQNCLWLYVIPSTNFTNTTTAESYVRDTALAGKFDLVLGGWEFGLGAFWKYETAPKAMLTMSGSLKNLSIFGEFVYRYGANSEWSSNTNWDNKTSIFQASVGISRYWKDQAIMLALQYYFDGNYVDKLFEGSYTYNGFPVTISVPSLTKGHNVALALNFGRLFGTTDLTASIFAMANFGKDELSPLARSYLNSSGYSSFFNTMTISGMLNYSPVSALTIGMGPYLTWETYENKPTVSLKLTATLGGGKF
ncbi:MAG: hypothetical protein K6C97_02445 [Treponema sp.]|nr:hypothetical protein [Treponema sp.]